MSDEQQYNETQEDNFVPTQELNPLEASYFVFGMQSNSDVIFDFLQGERGYFFDKNKKQ